MTGNGYSVTYFTIFYPRLELTVPIPDNYNHPGGRIMAIQYDYHMHSSFSTDSDAPAQTMVGKAMEAGLKGICFTDHMDL